MTPIIEIAHKFDLFIIEDATESLGAKYKGKMVGHLGDIACFSFNGNKIITTGGGGMIVTDNEAWANKARYLTTQAKDDPVEYIHNEIGYNYRMTNIQAAMGCAQIENLDKMVLTKRRIGSLYQKGLSQINGLTPMPETDWAFSTYWMYTIRINEKKSKTNSRLMMKQLGEFGIQTRPLWQPLHLSPAHKGSLSCQCINSEEINRECLSLPSSVNLSELDQKKVTNKILEYSDLRGEKCFG